MVPGEGFEPPTFGLQNRCTAAVLTRLLAVRCGPDRIRVARATPSMPQFAPSRILDERAILRDIGRQTIKTPGGEELVLMSRADYEELIDPREHAQAMAAYHRGEDEAITDAEMDDYLAAPTPLAFWRERRKLTPAALAAAVGISQPYLAQIETAARTGDVAVYARLARRLKVRIEDLLVEDAEQPTGSKP
jgi:DNA-binding XRE family transcriptional regulator